LEKAIITKVLQSAAAASKIGYNIQNKQHRTVTISVTQSNSSPRNWPTSSTRSKKVSF